MNHTEVKFPTGKVYKELMGRWCEVEWKRLLFNNMTGPRAIFTLSIACVGKLYNKDRLAKIGIATD